MVRFLLVVLGLSWSPLLLATCPDWMPIRAERELSALQGRLASWDRAYQRSGKMSVGNDIYDQALLRLVTWRACFPEADVPLAPATEELAYSSLPVSRLDEAIQVGVWLAGRTNVWLQPEVNGVAVTLTYEDGQLQSVVHPEKEREALDWTARARQIPAIPQRLSSDGHIVLQGTLYQRRKGHVQASHGGVGGRRQVVSWMLGDEFPVRAAEQTGLYIWDWPGGPERMQDRLSALVRLGFDDQSQWVVPVESLDDVLSQRDTWLYEPLPFSTEGVMLLQEGGDAERQGVVAWAYPPRMALARVVQVDFRSVADGRLMPVLMLEPVTLAGRTISRVEMDSLGRWRTLDIRPGDVIALRLTTSTGPRLESVAWRAVERPEVTLPQA